MGERKTYDTFHLMPEWHKVIVRLLGVSGCGGFTGNFHN